MSRRTNDSRLLRSTRPLLGRRLDAAALAVALAACASTTSDRAASDRAPATHASGLKLLTVDDLYDPEKKIDFAGSPPTNLVWLDDARLLWPKTDPKTKNAEWLEIDADSGKTQPFVAPAKIEAALAAMPEVGAEKAKKAARSDAGSWAGAPKAQLYEIGGDLYVVSTADGKAVRVTTSPAPDGTAAAPASDATPDATSAFEEEQAQLSPDGTRVAYVRSNDLYVVDVASGKEQRLTNDGSATVLNGKLDWLYQEEIYGRGTWRGFWWSPQSDRIAFLRLDEAGVPIWTLVDDVESPIEVETSPYPRAGDLNPGVQLGIAHVDTRAVEWVDLSHRYWGKEILIVDVAWSPDGDLAFQVQDREQTWLDLAVVPPGAPPFDEAHAPGADPNVSSSAVDPEAWKRLEEEIEKLSAELGDGEESGPRIGGYIRTRVRNAEGLPGTFYPRGGPGPTTLLRETSSTKTWVNTAGSPKWLADGSFLWFSESTGWKHIYHHDRDGKRLRAVTSGEWEARELRGVDEKNGWVYFAGTERNPIGSDEYRVKLDGTKLERLTPTRGTNSAKYNPSFTRFVGHWSDPLSPTQVRLHAADGKELRVLDANPPTVLSEYALSRPEFLKVRTRDGFEMEAMLLKPPDFDPSKRYPVFQFTYAGPHAPSVKDGWGGTGGLYLQLLAQRGVVVWVCDNRSASGKGAGSEAICYQRLGESELADIEDGLAWLKRQGWVDSDRIGMFGWSYGGFMTAYALTHSKSFAMGVAGGPVTDWRNYDSIYTERYMRTPQNNPQGYARTSIVAAAGNLHGQLMLVHGALDDNVHPQNTMQLAYALQKAGKPFRLMLYPKSRHGLSDKLLEKHFRATMLEFVEETLLGKGSGAARQDS